MSARAVVVGLALALFMCAFTYYNNQVLQQTFFVSNHLPIGIFGTLLLLVFVANPALRRVRGSWALKPAEVAIAGALGLAVCCWPYVGGFRAFTTSLSMPNARYEVETGWRGARAMSYVPGGSPLLADGFIPDFVKLAAAIRQGLAGHGDPLAQQLSQRLPEPARRSALRALDTATLQAADKRALIRGLNQLIEDPELGAALPAAAQHRGAVEALIRQRAAHQRTAQEQRRRADRLGAKGSTAAHQRKLLSRAADRSAQQAAVAGQRIHRILVERAFSGLVTPAPEGDGVLVDNGYNDPFVVGALVSGWDGLQHLSLWELPWGAWWPTLRLWGSVAVLLALSALCIAVIVHPQWSRRELLPYPIVGFLRDIVQTDQPGQLPNVCKSRVFWSGLLCMLGLNLVNGMHAWFPDVPEISLRFDFTPILNLFPALLPVSTSYDIFFFTLYPIVIAFTYFIRSDVAFSLGVSNIAWTLGAVVLVSNGVALRDGELGWGSVEVMRMGAGLGLTAMILFTGRHYYANVVASALGMRRHATTPGTSVWAARLLAVCFLVAVWILVRWAGVSWVFSTLVVAAILMAALVMARINAEGGVFLLAPGWSPTDMVPTLFGFRAIAPSQFFSMSMVSNTLWGDSRGAAMPFLLNSLKAADHAGGAGPRRSMPWLAAVLVFGFVICLGVSFMFQYNLGANLADEWARTVAIIAPFENLTRQVSRLAAHGELAAVVAAGDWERLRAIDPDWTAVLWIGSGLVLVILFAFGRLRFPWWPIHPVIFAVMGLWHVKIFATCFLIGWMIRVGVQRVSGARGYHRLKPFMIGVIGGELLSVVAWTMVGTVYYLVTGLTPTRYAILPN